MLGLRVHVEAGCSAPIPEEHARGCVWPQAETPSSSPGWDPALPPVPSVPYPLPIAAGPPTARPGHQDPRHPTHLHGVGARSQDPPPMAPRGFCRRSGGCLRGAGGRCLGGPIGSRTDVPALTLLFARDKGEAGGFWERRGAVSWMPGPLPGETSGGWPGASRAAGGIVPLLSSAQRSCHQHGRAGGGCGSISPGGLGDSVCLAVASHVAGTVAGSGVPVWHWVGEHGGDALLQRGNGEKPAQHSCWGDGVGWW